MAETLPDLGLRALGAATEPADLPADVRKYAAEQGIAEEAAWKKGVEERGREVAEKGNEIYAKA